MSWHWLVTDVGLRAFPMVAAFPQAIDGAGLRIGKDARAAYDLGQFRDAREGP